MKNIKYLILLALIILTFTTCKENEENLYELTPDLTDYTSDLPAMRQMFENNTIMYYAEYGLPAIASNSIYAEENGGDPLEAFENMLSYFNQQTATEAIENQLWSQEFINKMLEFNQEPMDIQWFIAILFFCEELFPYLIEESTDLRVNELYMMLGEGMNYAIDPQFYQDVSFEPGTPTNPAAVVFPDELCICEMEPFPLGALCQDRPNAGADDNATTKKKWKDVDNVYNTTKDGMCATKATGMCLNKLKKINDEVDGKTWNKISCDIKATSKGGAFTSDINAYYRTLGFGVTIAYDGWGYGSKTAVQQVNDAMDRGCDVKIVYHDGSWIGGESHIEYVTKKIEIDPNDNSKGVVHTNSWGSDATVTFDSDTFSGKSDGATTYGDKSFLNKTGKAWFIIYCKK